MDSDSSLADVATGAQGGVAIDPEGARALTSMDRGTVLVEWRLRPTVEPTRVVRISNGRPMRGPFGAVAGAAVAMVGDTSVCMREWRDIERAWELPDELVPRRRYLQTAAWSPDGRLLAIAKGEEMVVVDVGARVVVGDVNDLEDCALGDWSVRPAFSPDGRLLAVGNTMQGFWWQSMLEVSDGLRHRYEREELPDTGISDLVSAVAFSPDGRRFAVWVRPDHGHTGPNGYRGMAVSSWAETGEPFWHSHIDDEAAGVHGESYSAPLCFSSDGVYLAVGLDCGVLWLDAETGVALRMDATEGEVTALACAPHTGLVAATTRGLRCLESPVR
ncbi:WD40 repeat domain-containing protein [Nocardia sp. NPDC050406]|uniref:WD40 repeat domain-containing protein n=1 Tax=Nocardia sp. NPDC050406 TaxID=3364318 RepID=UPI0037BBD2BC